MDQKVEAVIKEICIPETKKKYKVISRTNKRLRRLITEKEADFVKKTGKYTFTIWPDRDSFHVHEQHDVILEEIIVQSYTTKNTIFFKKT